ncbi:hypothetical protein E5Q_06151 [Mixia osmundae IAM 14324]|uniref:Sacsin/Nov domain-containing protein n=1 Tax=Mixia osmundae (strain CBS 9802 / IAM 14324 / JCM 22182 / KY 12970) TaxID=764103 RepID=G7E9Y3_MIXOS|nr:hypothetical protein E5Q_06151 [Mixia osmundae IAM 14324]
MADYAHALASGVEEDVQVNQRALIDKILARYSGEYTVFRELLQNADDATATEVHIHFQTATAASQLSQHEPLSRIVVRNNGAVFSSDDWSRLATIAAGNPDQDKIGAFGVGFYSLFSLCECPLVASGREIMGFNWRDGKDQLYVKRARNPDESDIAQRWTSFIMDLRKPMPLYPIEAFVRFLSTALAFTSNVRSITLQYQEYTLAIITKSAAPTRPMALADNLHSLSPTRMMRITAVDQQSVQITAKVMRWVALEGNKTIAAEKANASTSSPISSSITKSTNLASRMLSSAFGISHTTKPTRQHASGSTTRAAEEESTPLAIDDPVELLTVVLFLRILTAHVKVQLAPAFAAEMERATKKAPPKSTKVQLLFNSSDEYEASRAASKKGDTSQTRRETEARRIFDGLSSDLDKQGRVFIGFATHQTTGCAASLAARFVPTVERESIDFQAPHVTEWNRELLWAGGMLARATYDAELAEIRSIWASLQQGGKAPDEESLAWLHRRSIHAMRFFTFATSTPSSVVAQDTAFHFFSAARDNSFIVMSSVGPMSASEIRLPSIELSFLKKLPTLPTAIMEGAPGLIGLLRQRSLLRDASLDDVLAELQTRALTVEEMRSCLTWYLSLAKDASYQPSLLDRFLSVALLQVDTGKEERIVPLSTIETVLNTRSISIPPELRLPPTCLPYALSRTFNADELRRVFRWSDLTAAAWLRHLFSAQMTGSEAEPATNILGNQLFAEKVLTSLARIWPGLSASNQQEVLSVAREMPFVPTKNGQRRATEAYFANVDLFEDLAIVTLPSGHEVKGNLQRFLLALGVRKHPEMQLVFTRLVGGGAWSQQDLARHLVSRKADLSSEELTRLVDTACWPREGEAAPAPGGRRKLYKARDLFEPQENLRTIGLPLLDWPTGKWRPNSDEGRFLLDSLRLRKTPTVKDLLEIASDPSRPIQQQKALTYYVGHFTSSNYASAFDPKHHDLPFVPCLLSDGSATYARPSEVFTSKAAALLGFRVVHSSYASEAVKFGLRSDPSSTALIDALLARPPPTISQASAIFGYLSTRVAFFSAAELARLKAAPFVFIKDGKGESFQAPGELYFSTGSSTLRSLIKTVDFGSEARPFLSAVGVKTEPSTIEIAQMIVNDPKKIYALAGSASEYLAILRQIASSSKTIPSSLQRQMRTAAWLLGSRRLPTSQKSRAGRKRSDSDDEDEDDGLISYDLCRAQDLVVIDDSNTAIIFADSISACPQEDVLEALAESLGAPRISALVTSRYNTTGSVRSATQRSQDLQKLVFERTALFLHERQTYQRQDVKRDAEWVKSHLSVGIVDSLEFHRTLKHQTVVKTHVTSASAAATLEDGQRKLMLYLAANIPEIDYFEVASSLCRLILTKPKLQDSLLFMTLLQTSLKNLKRRGFNVDRVLNARRLEKEAEEQRRREMEREEAAALLRKPLPDKNAAYTGEEPASSSGDAMVRRSSIEKSEHQQVFKGSTADTLQANAGPSPNFFNAFKKKLLSTQSGHHPLPVAVAGKSQASQFEQKQIVRQPQASGGLPDPKGTASPLSDIKQNVLRAVASSRPDFQQSVESKTELRQVKESEGTYCDASGANADLAFFADVAGLRFFVSQAVLQPSNIINEHGDALVRFINMIVKPIGRVFSVDPRSLHVFYDLGGPLIAFNRGGSIYLNLRFYLSWHDQQVIAGDLTEALISCFFTVSHELAHNISLAHDAQFSFYASAISEQYLSRFMASLNVTLRYPDISISATFFVSAARSRSPKTLPEDAVLVLRLQGRCYAARVERVERTAHRLDTANFEHPSLRQHTAVTLIHLHIAFIDTDHSASMVVTTNIAFAVALMAASAQAAYDYTPTAPKYSISKTDWTIQFPAVMPRPQVPAYTEFYRLWRAACINYVGPRGYHHVVDMFNISTPGYVQTRCGGIHKISESVWDPHGQVFDMTPAVAAAVKGAKIVGKMGVYYSPNGASKPVTTPPASSTSVTASSTSTTATSTTSVASPTATIAPELYIVQAPTGKSAKSYSGSFKSACKKAGGKPLVATASSTTVKAFCGQGTADITMAIITKTGGSVHALDVLLALLKLLTSLAAHARHDTGTRRYGLSAFFHRLIWQKLCLYVVNFDCTWQLNNNAVA